MINYMNEKKIYRIGWFLLKIGSLVIGFVLSLIATFRDLVSSIEIEQDDDRRIYDSELSGELNHRTGKLDSGLDPYGWYKD